MNVSPLRASHPVPASQRITLLGTGTVGRAFVARHVALNARGMTLPPLAGIANTRGFSRIDCDCPNAVLNQLRDSEAPSASEWIAGAEFGPGDIVVDASTSDVIAQQHAGWLRGGAHVVTACKLGAGTSRVRWQDIRDAQAETGVRYGDSATVGAGLPLLRTLRELAAGGDRITAVAGVLSGSLAYLMNNFDGMRPFSSFVHAAHAAGYTEPDPRDDLSGEDVRRKVLILARAAGLALDVEDVQVDSLVPLGLQPLSRAAFFERLPEIDAQMRAKFARAHKKGEVLKHIGRFEFLTDGTLIARVGLTSLPASHALAAGAGTDNRVAIWTDRYCENPLVIQGPGAGPEVTAGALLDDVLTIQRHH